MKTIINAIVVMACLCISSGIQAQTYAMKTYKLDPKKKTWMQSIHTFSKSGKWAKPDPKAQGALTPEASWTKWKLAFPELKSTSQYIGAAYGFKTKRPSGTLKKTLKNGHLVQYHDASKVFAAYTKSGYILTMFRAVEGKNYYDKIGVDPKYVYPGYIKKSSSSSARPTASSSSSTRPSSSSRPGGSSNKGSSSSTLAVKHTRDYYLKSYRPKPGTTTWISKPSTFKKISTSKWHAKKNVAAAQNAKLKHTKHRGAFPEVKSIIEYVSAAHKFRNSPPPEQLRKDMENGDLVLYDEKSNVFAAYDQARLPRTMFRPKAGIQYWEDLENVKVIQYDGYGAYGPVPNLDEEESKYDKVHVKESNSSSSSDGYSKPPPPENYNNESSLPAKIDKAQLAKIAMDLCTPKTPQEKSVGFKKSWDAVEHMLVLSKFISPAEAKKKIALKDIIDSTAPKVKRVQSVPKGLIIGLFLPTPGGSKSATVPKERLVHMMVSMGNGKAVGTGNKVAMGIGLPKGIEEVDLTEVDMDLEDGTFDASIGSRSVAFTMRAINPDGSIPDFEDRSDTGSDMSMDTEWGKQKADSDDDTDSNMSLVTDWNYDAQVAANLAYDDFQEGPVEDEDDGDEYDDFQESAFVGATKSDDSPFASPSNTSDDNADYSIWIPSGNHSVEATAKAYFKREQKNFAKAKTPTEYTNLAIYFRDNPPEGVMFKVKKNGDKVYYYPPQNLFAAYNKEGKIYSFMKPAKRYQHFTPVIYEAVCSRNGKRSFALDLSPAPKELKGYVNDQDYMLIPLPKGYEGENLGKYVPFKNSHVEYCSTAERQALEVFVKNGILVNRLGEPINTLGATRALASAPPDLGIFAMDTNGRLYVYNYSLVARFHHSSFLSGGPVAAAGEIKIVDGIVKEISARSGHYKPSVDHVSQVLSQLIERGYKHKFPKIDKGF